MNGHMRPTKGEIEAKEAHAASSIRSSINSYQQIIIIEEKTIHKALIKSDFHVVSPSTSHTYTLIQCIESQLAALPSPNPLILTRLIFWLPANLFRNRLPRSRDVFISYCFKRTVCRLDGKIDERFSSIRGGKMSKNKIFLDI